MTDIGIGTRIARWRDQIEQDLDECEDDELLAALTDLDEALARTLEVLTDVPG
jgi:hypothetical protein